MLRSPGLRLAAVGVVLVVAVAGCSGGGATISAEEAPDLVLQRSDLPPVFVQFDEGEQVRADSPPGSRADPTRFGREGGWKARYKRSGSPRTRGALVVESRLDLFESDGGAQDDLDAYESQFEASIQGAVAGRLLRVSGLGDRALAITFRQGTPPFATRFFTIAWREANVTASVSVNGFDGKVSKQDALALARKQQRRIARALS